MDDETQAAATAERPARSDAAASARARILDFCGPSLAAYGIDPAEASDDLDLRACGAIDSLGFVELVVVLEETFGIELELEDADPETLTVLGPLSDQVATRIAGGAGAAR